MEGVCHEIINFFKIIRFTEGSKEPRRVRGELKPETRQHLKMLIEGILIEEQTRSLTAPRHARKLTRLDYRNGFYRRDIESCMGLIENIKVPRARIATLEFSLFKKYRRKEVGGVLLFEKANIF